VPQKKSVASLYNGHYNGHYTETFQFSQDRPKTVSIEGDNVTWEWAGVGTKMKFSGTFEPVSIVDPTPKGIPRPIEKLHEEDLLRQLFGDTTMEVQGGGANLQALPTDADQVRMIIEDPYGWISDYYQYDSSSDRKINRVDNELLKVVQVRLDSRQPGAPGERGYRNSGEMSGPFVTLVLRVILTHPGPVFDSGIPLTQEIT